MSTLHANSGNAGTSFIQGLRIVYEETGHTGNFFANKKEGTMHGNPLTEFRSWLFCALLLECPW